MAALTAPAQLFRHLSTKDGMTSRHVISLRKDRTGYLWMLNHEGVDRFDGSRITHYTLRTDEGPLSPTRGLASLATDSARTLWVISHTGDLFSYDEPTDSFLPALDFALMRPHEGRSQPLTASYMDTCRHGIWLCTRSAQYLFSLSDRHLYALPTGVHQPVNAVVRTPDDVYFLATEQGVTALRLTEEPASSAYRQFHLRPESHPELATLPHVRALYFHPDTHLLVLATADSGLYIYNRYARRMERCLTSLKDVEVSTFAPVPGQRQQVYVATQGAGLYRLTLPEGQLTPFLQANPNTPHSLQSDILNDLYIDDVQRLWMATYPMGVSVYSQQYPAHEWICHSYDNSNSLSSGQVHDILEDADGDLWFATNNGVSCQHGGRWHTLLTQAQSTDGRRNYTFTALCDLGDGRILAGGYMSGIYLIHKSTMKAEALPLPDKYVRSIVLTHRPDGQSDGQVWVGGQQKLIQLDSRTLQTVREWHTGFPIASLAEQDADRLWVGTLNGLYRLDRRRGRLTRIEPHAEMGRITSICPTPQGITYLSTMGDGLWAYTPPLPGQHEGRFAHFTAANSSLLTDDVYCILPLSDGRLLLSTEQGVATYSPRERRFYHWGRDQGLMFTSFNPGAGLHTRSGRCLFGTEEGALSFSDTVTLCRPFHSRLVLGAYDRTASLTLPHPHHDLELEVSSLNFDNPSSILYSWQLEGYGDGWSTPSRQGRVRYTSLPPGRYLLRVRSLRADDLQPVEERTLALDVRPPWWLSWPALTVYALLVLGACILLCRLYWMRRVKTIVSQTISQNRSLDELFMQRVEEVVKERLTGDGLSVEVLCNELNVSRSTLYNRLKEITGEAPADYLRRRRMDESARLLLTRQYNVAEVSDRLGFSDPKYFTEVFKRYFGLTPTQYIRQNLGASE
jgi:AraC-like DNA-binding protein/ligand-binding sensor domain-containing protein